MGGLADRAGGRAWWRSRPNSRERSGHGEGKQQWGPHDASWVGAMYEESCGSRGGQAVLTGSGERYPQVTAEALV